MTQERHYTIEVQIPLHLFDTPGALHLEVAECGSPTISGLWNATYQSISSRAVKLATPNWDNMTAWHLIKPQNVDLPS